MRTSRRSSQLQRHEAAYLPGLDGLRAIAVVSVLLFHGGIERFGGGFLGVEVFFVVSGFLITLLLTREHAGAGSIDLRPFWLRRARRLLPAAAVVVFSVLLYAIFVLPDEVSGLRSDAASAAGYVTNWWLIFGNQPYFEVMGRPSLLQHLWSLAVEEQFYLAWPAILWVLLRFAGKRGAAAFAIAAAIASYALMWTLHNPASDPARVYYGTDTRAGALLAGAALALLWDPRVSPAFPRRRVRRGLVCLGMTSFGALAVVFTRIDSASPWLYPWGFVATTLATLGAVAAATHPASALAARTLSMAPLRWAGTRSYALYLWHWPIFQVTRPGFDVPLDGLDLLLVRLGLVAVAAELSYRFVEQPLRSPVTWEKFRRIFYRAPARARLVSASSGFAAVAFGFAVFQAHPAATPAYLSAGGFQGIVGPALSTPSTPAAFGPVRPVEGPLEVGPEAVLVEVEQPLAPTPTAMPTAVPAVPPAVSTVSPAPPPPPPRPPITAPIMAIGDSVLLGAAPYLGVVGTVHVDAVVGRQSGEVVRMVQSMAAAGRLPEILIIHTGNNGPLTGGQVDAIMEAAAGRRVVFITVRVGRPWEATTNGSIWDAAAKYANVRVADWYEASSGHPELFISDGIHLKAEGATVFAAVVAWAAN